MVGVSEAPVNESFAIYPVPNNGLFNAAIHSRVDDRFTIIACNQLGEKMTTLHDVKTIGGKAVQEIDLRPENNGIYFVVFTNDHLSIVRKIFVDRSLEM